MKKIWDMYQYLFYKYYTWNLWLNRGMDPFAYQAGITVLSLLIVINIMTLLEIINIVAGVDLLQLGNPKLSLTIMTIAFCYINLLIFKSHKRYKKIIKRFEQEDRKSKILGNMFAWFCFLGSFAILIGTAFLERYFNPNITNADLRNVSINAVQNKFNEINTDDKLKLPTPNFSG